MVNNIKKKILCFAICIISFIIMMNSSKIFASEVNYSNIYSEDEIEILANHWLNSNYKDSTKIEEIIPVKSNDNIILYCVEFIKEEIPNGYVMINALRESKELYTEFSLNGNSIYDTICISNDIDKADEKVLYNIGSLNYALKNEDKYCTLDKKKYNYKTVKELMKRNKKKVYKDYECTSKVPYIDGVLSLEQLPAGKIKEERYIDGGDTFLPLCNQFYFDYFNNHKNTGNCVPTAANNIICLYKEKRGFNKFPESLYTSYEGFISCSNYDVNAVYEGINSDEFDDAMRKYVEKVGYKYSSDKYWWDLFGDWKRDIKKDYPVYTSIRGYVDKDKNLEDDVHIYEESGHAVVTVGYRIFEDGTQYLIIYDGWNYAQVRYINFDSDYFLSIDGIRIKIYD